MRPEITWPEIALRLALSVIAGTIIGINREEQGRPAGFRTTVLVCLAASISMIQVNLMLSMSGKTPSSFAVMDLMRLPLGILSGMGFIGAGAILRRPEKQVHGVTTAATLWFTTVMGLCLGGGQIGLGLASLVLGLATLLGLKKIERGLHQDRTATLHLSIATENFSDLVIREELRTEGFKITSCSMTSLPKDRKCEITYEIHWRGHPGDSTIPSIYEKLMQHPSVRRIEWKP
jgi:putative Mg2+ transporter-C (MgtC) family protein